MFRIDFYRMSGECYQYMPCVLLGKFFAAIWIIHNFLNDDIVGKRKAVDVLVKLFDFAIKEMVRVSWL
ncbi:hypothetical protein VI06_17915 [Aquitalea magnusonii]|nr:hypothetical protein VI06_17915 [Aquitalea magnusonii]